MEMTTAERLPHAAAATAHPAAAAPTRRDLYAPIHKALRLAMTRTLTEVGSTDPGSHAEVEATLERVRALVAFCELHLKDEDEFVHPALERARPGVTARVGADHAHHTGSFADLRDLVSLVADSADAARPAALARLYRALALFVGENFEHMHHEETVHNPVLWAAYGDSELAAIEQALVASIPPQAMFEALHWFLPALSAPERAGMLAEMSHGMPPEPFRAVLGIAERTLSAGQHARLMRDLGLAAAA
jgi:iron-sulfur cluster repair protein YtfE (RIC family)